MTTYINLFHIFVIVPLIFLAYFKRSSVPVSYYKLAFGVILLAWFAHIWMYMHMNKENKWKDWIYMSHILVVFPILGYLCWLGLHSPPPPARKWFELSLVLGFAALGYHSFNLYRYTK